MKRREFIKIIGGSIGVLSPLVGRAQQGERMRRIAVLQGGADDPHSHPNADAFLGALDRLSWTDGRNVRVDYRWPQGDAVKSGKYAEELVALAPDVILASATPSVLAVQQATRTVPIVFVLVPDAVGTGIVASLSRPGGNATGFVLFEYDLSAKWVEILKQVAPGLKRVAVLRDPAITSGIGQFAVIQYVAPSAGVEVSPVDVRDASAIESVLASFSRVGNVGLIVAASPSSLVQRELIIALAARHKLPTVYFQRTFVAGGGLISYGPDVVDQFRRAASYVDRILRGDKPADLPVQAPTKYELAINLKTAKVLGLDVPHTLVVRADEVIE